MCFIYFIDACMLKGSECFKNIVKKRRGMIGWGIDKKNQKYEINRRIHIYAYLYSLIYRHTHESFLISLTIKMITLINF